MTKKKVETVTDEPEGAQDIEQTEPVVTWTPDPEAPHHGVSFALSRGVLVALLDPEHTLADTVGAEYLGLIADGALTPIGEIVARSFDAIAVGHKMSAAFRAAHNAELGRRK